VSQLSVRPNASDMASGPFYLNSPLLTSYNQQLWLLAQIVTENKDGRSLLKDCHWYTFKGQQWTTLAILSDESFEKKFHVTVFMEGISEDEHASKHIDGYHLHNR
jgi:hypothetical protein